MIRQPVLGKRFRRYQVLVAVRKTCGPLRLPSIFLVHKVFHLTKTSFIMAF